MQDVYSAVRRSIEKTRALPERQGLQVSYFWRAEAGNYQSNCL